MPAIAQQKDGDYLAVVRSINLRMTKVWDSATGPIRGYDRVRQVKPSEVFVSDIHELSDVLATLEKDSEACILRGRFVGMEAAQAALPGILERDRKAGRNGSELKPGYVLRRVDLFPDRPLHYFMIDIDGFKPQGVDHLADPETAIAQYVETKLPECFHQISYHWQLSSSAGHPDAAGILKAHVWFWLKTPQLGQHLKAWVDALNLDIDTCVFEAVQPNYTGAPVFTNGTIDPVRVRSGLFHGLIDDAVDLVIPEALLAKALTVRKKRDDMVDPSEKDNIVGLFCRTFEIEEVIERWLSEVFEFVTDERLTYLLSSSGAKEGARICDHRQGIFNSHDSDPFNNRAANKWDLVRVYRFGELDAGLSAEEKEALGMGGMPSQKAMLEMVRALPEIQSTQQTEISGMFEVLELERDANGEVEQPLPAFRRNRQGEILADLDNIIMGMNSFAVSECYIAWDEFRGMVVMTEQQDGAGGWRPIEDHDAVMFRLRLERVGFKPVGREIMRDVIKYLANQNKFDSAILWGRRLCWDGTPRINTFFEKYFGVSDAKYARALSRYLWTALAGRLMVPGIKADIALILIGLQGAGKSTAVAAMSPFDDWFCELDLSADDDKKARMLRGKVIAEFGEMRGMYAREVSHIKAFMTKQFEEWVPKFIEYTTRYYRRTVFVGTSNEDEVLADRTGNRRWAPVRVGAVDVDAIRRDREQLWAEAIQLFEAEGVLFQEVEALAKDKHADHMQEDAWSDAVMTWLNQEDDDGRKNGTRRLKLLEVIRAALFIETSRADRKTQLRMKDILSDRGFVKKRTNSGPYWENRAFK